MRSVSVVVALVVALSASTPLAIGARSSTGATNVIEQPDWEPGTAWHVTLRDPGLALPVTATLVALRHDLGAWRFAYTSPIPEMLFARTIPLGHVERTPLRFSVDGTAFEALRFPVVAGDSWQTSLGDAALVATVTSVDHDIAHMTYQSDTSPFLLNATYDAKAGFFTKMEQPNGQHVEFSRVRDPACAGWSPHGVHSFEGEVARYRGSAMERFEVPTSVRHLVFRLAIESDPEGGSPYGVAEQEQHAIKVVGPSPETTQSPELVQTGPARNETAFFKTDATEGRSVAGAWTASRTKPTVWNQWRSVVEVIGYEEAHVVEDAECSSDLGASAVSANVGPREATGTLAWIGIGMGGALAVFWGARRTFAWFLLARITPDRALGHPTRERFLSRIEQEPGITTFELSRELEVPWTTTLHHLRILERVGLAHRQRQGGNVHWFSDRGASLGRERVAIATLRRAATARVYDFIRANPGVSLTSVARGLGVRHPTVLFHLRKLVAAGLVEPRPHGRRNRYHAVVR